VTDGAKLALARKYGEPHLGRTLQALRHVGAEISSGQAPGRTRTNGWRWDRTNRIEELAYGGLKPETIKRLEAIAENLDGGDPVRRRQPVKDRPISRTRLIREWQGVEHCVTVRDEDFEYQGRPYKSLSVVARAITGTRWNGLVFFGLKNQRGRS
jgi:hypothetical protein